MKAKDEVKPHSMANMCGESGFSEFPLEKTVEPSGVSCNFNELLAIKRMMIFLFRLMRKHTFQ